MNLEYSQLEQKGGQPSSSRPLSLLVVDVVNSTHWITSNVNLGPNLIDQLLSTSPASLHRNESFMQLERRGDGALYLFSSSIRALEFAEQLHKRAREVSLEGRILQLRCAIHSSNELSWDAQHFGADSTLAFRFASIGLPETTTITQQAHAQLNEIAGSEFEDLGWVFLKNYADPIRAYRAYLQGRSSLQIRENRNAEVQAESASDPRMLIAVYIPQHFSFDPEKLVLQESILRDVIEALGRSSFLRVVSANSAIKAGLADLSSYEVARLFRADYVVSLIFEYIGTDTFHIGLSCFERQSGSFINDRQVKVRGNTQVASDVELLTAIAENVADQINKTEIRRTEFFALPNLAAHSLLLGSIRKLHRFSRDEFFIANAMLDELNARLPNHPIPHVWKARWHTFLVLQKWSQDGKKDMLRANDHCARALDVAPNLPLALTISGGCRMAFDQDANAAVSLYRQALEINQSESLAWLLSGVAQGFSGQPSAAVRAANTAMSLSPIDPIKYYYQSLSASAAVSAQAYDSAIELAQAAIRSNQTFGSSYRALAIAQWMSGHEEDARKTIQRLLCFEPNSTVAQALSRAAVTNPLNTLHAQALATAGLPKI